MLDSLNDAMNNFAEDLISTEDFNKEFMSHVELVSNFVEKSRGSEKPTKSWVPKVILVVGHETQREVIIVGVDLPENTLEKRALMAIFQAEAWTAQVEGDTCKNGYHGPRPSERPDRREIIVVVGRSIDGRQAIASIPITGRDADGCLRLGEPDVHVFDDGKSVTYEDNLLGGFFQAYCAAYMSVIQADFLKGKGQEVPREVDLMLDLIKSCPIKLR